MNYDVNLEELGYAYEIWCGFIHCGVFDLLLYLLVVCVIIHWELTMGFLTVAKKV